ncbi:MAG: hypothetical protein OEM00_13565, partial [Burkholderiaceae bacterium]|nr:hypothetical protein [Burkholderiaceae bacterium]
MSDVACLGVTPTDLAAGRPYVERAERDVAWHDRLAIGLWSRLPAAWRMAAAGRAKPGRSFLATVRRQAKQALLLSDDDLRLQAQGLGRQFHRKGFDSVPSARVFALIGEAAFRVLGKRPYETQYVAAWSLLQGTLVEMATGEGKTFAATLPACAVALSRLSVHVVTVNDYLAERDAAEMGPLYRFFGLDVGVVVQGMPRPQR